MLKRFTFLHFLPVLLVSLGGCATNIPRDIQEPPPDNPAINDVRQDIDKYMGAKVRWGGTIASVENKEDQTWVEVVGTELDSYGEPLSRDTSFGRFLVRIDQFLDPQIYARGRELTVAGEVESRIVRPIGDHPYAYPLIRARTYYLWPRDDRYYASPYYSYGHFYGHPFFHHPFHHRFHFFHGFHRFHHGHHW